MKICSTVACEGLVYAKELCRSHYAKRLYREHQAGFKGDARTRECVVEGCTARTRNARGICPSHGRVCDRYSITPTQYVSLMESGCFICGARSSGARALHIDHDHACCPESARSCGKCIRGVLCGGCNVGLGVFGDDISKLRRAIEYLSSNMSTVM